MKANKHFENQNYIEAIKYYNLAIEEAGVEVSPILYGNRAAALIKRNWDSDIYLAMKDCYTALTIDKTHMKSHFRLCRCLCDLKMFKEAHDCLDIFKERFPDYARSEICDKLESDINSGMKEAQKKEESALKRKNKSQSGTKSKKQEDFLKKEDKDDNKSEEEEEDTNDEEYNEICKDSKRLIFKYKEMKTNSTDFRKRYSGHCNVATDIKECTFLGQLVL
jgi:WD and tetratricopeptide repeats protein 1